MKTSGLNIVLSLSLVFSLMMGSVPLSAFAVEVGEEDASTQEGDTLTLVSELDAAGLDAQAGDDSVSDAIANDVEGEKSDLATPSDEPALTGLSAQESITPQYYGSDPTRIIVENAVKGGLKDTIDAHLAETQRPSNYDYYKVLDVSGVMNQDDFEFVCDEFKSLTDLDLRETYLPGVSVKSIYKLAKLFLVSLSGTEIEGELKDFAGLKNLMSLEISTQGSPTFSGDLSDLGPLKDLGNLHAAGQDITGDIDDLGTSFAYLVLSDTSVSGDIATLKNFRDHNNDYKAENIFLANTKVSGSLSSIKDVVSITELDVSGTAVTGNLADLSRMIKMKILRVANTSIAGSYEDLLPFDAWLHEVDLSNSSIGGDLAWFNNLPRMLDLILENSPVTGNIGDIKDLPMLRVLNVNRTSVGGDIAQLANAKTLAELHVRDTDIVGDISSLGSLGQLTKVVMDNTKLTGDISSFKELTSLNTLSASNTAIGGNLASLSEITSLIELNLSQSSVVGDIASFKDLPNIQAVNLSGTDTYGDIASLKNLILLKLINLSKTHIYGNVAELYALVDLVSLDLSDISIIMPALSLDAFPLASVVPFKDHTATTITPQNLKGGSYDPAQGVVTWNKPGSHTDTLGYSFSATVAIGQTTGIYSGTFAQPLIAPVPAPTVLAPTGDVHLGSLFAVLSLSALLLAALMVRSRCTVVNGAAKRSK